MRGGWQPQAVPPPGVCCLGLFCWFLEASGILTRFSETLVACSLSTGLGSLVEMKTFGSYPNLDLTEVQELDFTV